MDKIHWDQTFSVGVPKLDQQHQLILGAINELVEGLARPGEPMPLADILGTLTSYTNLHFETEERLLAEQSCPDLPMQRREHKAFRRRIATFCMDAMTSHASVPEEILQYLEAWWVDHIRVKDMQYRTFLSSRMSGSATR